MSRNNDELIPEMPQIIIETKTSINKNNRIASPKSNNIKSPLNNNKGINRKIGQTYIESSN